MRLGALPGIAACAHCPEPAGPGETLHRGVLTTAAVSFAMAQGLNSASVYGCCSRNTCGPAASKLCWQMVTLTKLSGWERNFIWKVAAVGVMVSVPSSPPANDQRDSDKTHTCARACEILLHV